MAGILWLPPRSTVAPMFPTVNIKHGCVLSDSYVGGGERDTRLPILEHHELGHEGQNGGISLLEEKDDPGKEENALVLQQD